MVLAVFNHIFPSHCHQRASPWKKFAFIRVYSPTLMACDYDVVLHKWVFFSVQCVRKAGDLSFGFCSGHGFVTHTDANTFLLFSESPFCKISLCKDQLWPIPSLLLGSENLGRSLIKVHHVLYFLGVHYGLGPSSVIPCLSVLFSQAAVNRGICMFSLIYLESYIVLDDVSCSAAPLVSGTEGLKLSALPTGTQQPAATANNLMHNWIAGEKTLHWKKELSVSEDKGGLQSERRQICWS